MVADSDVGEPPSLSTRSSSPKAFSMATSNGPSQRPKFQFSQSFRSQSTQDALAEVAPSARTTSDPHSSDILASDATTTSNIEGISRHVATNGNFSLSEENLHHRLNASGSVQAIAVDDDVLFAGLQGGNIVVSMLHASLTSILLNPLGLVTRDL